MRNLVEELKIVPLIIGKGPLYRGLFRATEDIREVMAEVLTEYVLKDDGTEQVYHIFGTTAICSRERLEIIGEDTQGIADAHETMESWLNRKLPVY